jgi:hypothetical protein
MPASAVTVTANHGVPIITSGANQSWTKGSSSGVTITCNGSYYAFTGLEIDGVAVPGANYTAVSGSTVVTLNAAYLQTLANGAHTVTFVYPNNATVSTGLTIVASGSGSGGSGTTPASALRSGSARTGDDSAMEIWLAALLISGLGITGLLGWRKRHMIKAK